MQTFVHALRRAEALAGHREALVCDRTRLTYHEFGHRLRRLHGALVELATDPGDRIAVLSFNSIPFVELYCGIPMAGRVQVPLNFRWAAPELAYALRDAGARVLFCDRDPGGLGDIVERVVRIDLGEYDELLDSAPPLEFDDDALREDDLAGLFYTGGTTGASKGVKLTHRNLVANAVNAQFIQPMTVDDRYLVMAPMFHAAGSISVLQSVFLGATQVILPAFAPAAMLDLVAAEGITQTLGVPTMVAATVEEQLARPRDVGTFRVYAHGGSPIAMEVVRRGVQAFPGTAFVHLYGATETAPLVTGTADEVALLDTEREKSAGQPVMGCEIVIRGTDGEPIPTGQAGEVTIRGANVMAGYWNKPEQTSAALRDGWYWSGDVGRVDEAGYLYLLDRSKDMIISGGENVYCTEVEDAIYAHAAVLEATVFGVPSDEWGEAVHAVVVLRDGESLTGDELIEHCRALIAGYKVPRSVEFRTEPLPTSGPGKVLKRELRAPYWASRDASIG
ncbi:MAG: AMP-binding protein [Ilumatobacter sp.]|uniref:class I adenylate-forming enzyme family protein n=1 Tax=Ilumatobacter sp. TaxID=1967498 RepID=UPI0026129AF4|nr:AMP-binding protein [Ilumatobacter sp.]MDJ0770976.1 AMP-binding protein [Ilumatobacter sp.]